MSTTPFEQALSQGLEATRASATEVALAALRAASRIEPAHPLPHFLIGANLAASGQPEAAEAAYAESLRLDPAQGVARFQLGLLQLLRGDLAGASTTWRPVLDDPAEHPLRLFAQGLLEVARGNTGLAKVLIERGIDIGPGNAALNADMRGVLGRMTSAGAVADRDAKAAANAAGQHFLINNYGRS